MTDMTPPASNLTTKRFGIVWDYKSVICVIDQHLAALHSTASARDLLEGMRDAGLVKIGELPTRAIVALALEAAE